MEEEVNKAEVKDKMMTEQKKREIEEAYQYYNFILSLRLQ
jgi:hypothetical protein